jgi:signal transduction histidine kinase
MKNGENFILSKKDKGNYITICFLPIKNVEGIKNSAYLVLYNNSEYLKQIGFNYYKMLFIILLMIVVFIFYLKMKYGNRQREKEKEKFLAQQSKMASMGEMIANIAHQWRQPLSVISTSASGVQMQKDYGLLNDEILDESMESILNNTEYLNQTIEDFRNFFKEDKETLMIFKLHLIQMN